MALSVFGDEDFFMISSSYMNCLFILGVRAGRSGRGNRVSSVLAKLLLLAKECFVPTSQIICHNLVFFGYRGVCFYNLIGLMGSVDDLVNSHIDR